MRHIAVVPHVDLESLARSRINHRSGYAILVEGLIDVGLDQLVWLRNEISRIEVLPIDNRIQPTCVDLGWRNGPILMALVAHAVTTVLRLPGFLFQRLHRT